MLLIRPTFSDNNKIRFTKLCNRLNSELEERHEARLTPHFVNYHNNKHKS